MPEKSGRREAKFSTKRNEKVKNSMPGNFRLFLREQGAAWEVLGGLLEALGGSFGASLRNLGRFLGGLRGISGRSENDLGCFAGSFS